MTSAPSPAVPPPPDEAARTQQLLDAVASPVRREILWLVWDRELTAGEIAGAFTLAAPTISSHLAVLRRAGLVVMTKDGTFRRYRTRTSAVEGIRSLLAQDDRKWESRGGPSPLAPHHTVAAVVVTVVVPVGPPSAFRAFVDPAVFSRWIGVPVTIDDGHLAMTMEWGLPVRGRYEHVVAPSLIVMQWDFERAEVPLPGGTLRAYLEVTARPDGTSQVEVTQLVRSDREARYLERAWGLVLSRLVAGVEAALGAGR